MEKKSQLSGSILLLIASVIWGCAFVAQSEAMAYMDPLTFHAARSVLGGLVLLPAVPFAARARKQSQGAPDRSVRRRTWIAGAVCGVILFVGTMFQQYGLKLGATGGKAGFLTALYILLVPLFGLLRGKRPGRRLWLGVALAVCGLYFLCITETLSFAASDLLLLCCALFFAFHILAVDHLTPGLSGVAVSCIQFFVSALLAGVGMWIFEHPTWAQIRAGWITVAYTGVLSSGVAYTLQILGQQRTAPAVASLLMSFESVFALLGTVVITGAIPTPREWVGCALMFAAIVVSQLPRR